MNNSEVARISFAAVVHLIVAKAPTSHSGVPVTLVPDVGGGFRFELK